MFCDGIVAKSGVLSFTADFSCMALVVESCLDKEAKLTASPSRHLGAEVSGNHVPLTVREIFKRSSV